jgi:hypothetical protein
MMERIAEASPRLKARIAGVLYLIVIVGGIFAELFVRGRLIVSGDAAATAHNILAHELLYRLGFAAGVITLACNIPLAVIFYDLLKVVNRSISLMVAFFILVGTAIESVSLLNHFAPLVLLKGGPGLSVSNAEQLHALAYKSLRLQSVGWDIALVFFGFYCLATGYLAFRSTFLPRIVGVLMAIAGSSYLTNSFAGFLAPGLRAHLLPYILVPCGVAELSLTLWLLVVGVNDQRWKEQASAAGDWRS